MPNAKWEMENVVFLPDTDALPRAGSGDAPSGMLRLVLSDTGALRK